MNTYDLSCAFSAEKAVKGVIDKIGEQINAFRVIKYGFAFSSDIEQSITGLRHQGGRITRSPFFIILTGENFDDLHISATANNTLGECKICIYHNTKDNKKNMHIETILDDCNIQLFSLINANSAGSLSSIDIAKNLNEHGYDIVEDLTNKGNLFNSNNNRNQSLKTGNYVLLLLAYNAIKLKVKKINVEGQEQGMHAAQYKPYLYS